METITFYGIEDRVKTSWTFPSDMFDTDVLNEFKSTNRISHDKIKLVHELFIHIIADRHLRKMLQVQLEQAADDSCCMGFSANYIGNRYYRFVEEFSYNNTMDQYAIINTVFNEYGVISISRLVHYQEGYLSLSSVYL